MPIPEPNARAELLRLALAFLDAHPVFPVRVRIRDAVGTETELVFHRSGSVDVGTVNPPPQGGTVVPPPLPVGADISDDAPTGTFRRIYRKLIEKATPEPMPTKRLIALAGYTVNTYSRDAVTHLCRLGYLERTPDGIRAGRRRLAG